MYELAKTCEYYKPFVRSLCKHSYRPQSVFHISTNPRMVALPSELSHSKCVNVLIFCDFDDCCEIIALLERTEFVPP